MDRGDKPAEDSFLSRWSRRKVEATTESQISADSLASGSSIGAPPGTKMPETPRPEPTLPGETESKQPLPSIEGLTHEADFSPFMARDVDPGLRNQAMRKLFTDPHYQFEQMDKLDIYIDDYSKPDPIPLDMLRKMTQAARLGLFDDEPDASSMPLSTPDVTAAPVASTSIAALPNEPQECSPPGQIAHTKVDSFPKAVPPALAPVTPGEKQPG